jgi:hypothetical protein
MVLIIRYRFKKYLFQTNYGEKQQLNKKHSSRRIIMIYFTFTVEKDFIGKDCINYG